MSCPICKGNLTTPSDKDFWIHAGKQLLKYGSGVGIVTGLFNIGKEIFNVFDGAFNESSHKEFFVRDDIWVCRNCNNFIIECKCGKYISIGHSLPGPGYKKECHHCSTIMCFDSEPGDHTYSG